MSKRILIAGASGMVGGGILELALQSSQVAEVISLVRKKSGRVHEKLQEHVVPDFTSMEEHGELFEGVDVGHFCIGVYTGQVPDDLFKTITVDYAVAFAKMLKSRSPNARMCLLSGSGADRSEKSRTSFARYKGMAENRIVEMGGTFHSLRPGYIYPVVSRKEPNLMYRISRALYPLLKLMGPKYSVPSTDLSKAMFLVGLHGHKLEILENPDILGVVAD